VRKWTALSTALEGCTNIVRNSSIVVFAGDTELSDSPPHHLFKLFQDALIRFVCLVYFMPEQIHTTQ
jgi:hypothetical protein